MVHIIANKYETLEKLGAGGMGTVYKARHRTLGTISALKVLLAELAEHAALMERFHDEARIMATLDHSNIVQVLDVDHDAETHFIVMEYIKGKSLNEYLLEQGTATPA